MKDVKETASSSSNEPVILIQRSAPRDAWEELLEKLPHIPDTGREIPLEAMSRETLYEDRA
jgi:hypothetical protein